MISRTWKGTTRAADADAYLRYLNETGLGTLRATPGNLAVLCLRRIRGERAEFQVWSLWESEAGIRAFAGDDIGSAVFYPEDDDYLIEKDEHVDHFEVVFHQGRAPELSLQERPAR